MQDPRVCAALMHEGGHPELQCFTQSRFNLWRSQGHVHEGQSHAQQIPGETGDK